MPSGKVHAFTSVLVTSAVGSTLLVAGGPPLASVAAITGGCLAGLVVNPDLDVRRPTHSHYLVRRSGGLILALAWRVLWWPYANLLIPYHRHPLSHFPILGTAVRVGYLLGILALAWWVMRVFFPLPAFTPLLFEPLWWWGFGGLALVDILHALMDWFWPFD